ncbi:hypothetical protein ABZX88_34320 [Kitasatospora aureofaciens]|uniref:hypothetical protein n=1 Tax=Kitasatospora aureofaciens TaxID=1894 RepID=UPI0033A26323
MDLPTIYTSAYTKPKLSDAEQDHVRGADTGVLAGEAGRAAYAAAHLAAQTSEPARHARLIAEAQAFAAVASALAQVSLLPGNSAAVHDRVSLPAFGELGEGPGNYSLR